MRSLSIGLVYETFETYPVHPGDPPDAHVEYEPESTIEALESAIKTLGHRPLRLGSPHALLERLAAAGRPEVDVVMNLAEGFGGRNREAWAPVLLEMAGVPMLGSDALSLSLSLDKAWANAFLGAAGVPVAPRVVLGDAAAARTATLPAPFPLFVKPRWEGTAKGIRPSSKVETRAALEREVERIRRDYDQPALVEAFVPGPEFTVSLIGNGPPAALPAVQRALDRATGIGIHALEGPGHGPGARAAGWPGDPVPGCEAGWPGGLEAALEPVTPGQLEPALEARLAQLAIRAFEALECRDFARVDFRLDATGEPVFLEINPLPTFATDGTFAILAELEGTTLDAMLGRCIRAGLERLGLAEPGRAEDASCGVLATPLGAAEARCARPRPLRSGRSGQSEGMARADATSAAGAYGEAAIRGTE
ncbi:MAG: D-alanine--D-alanine ligase [Myxococcota bacterium]